MEHFFICFIDYSFLHKSMIYERSPYQYENYAELRALFGRVE